MTDDEIRGFISKLDSKVSKEEAEVIFRSFGETAICANREGYLRLGIEFLRCALDGTHPAPDIDYMVSAESDFGIDHFTSTREELEFVSS